MSRFFKRDSESETNSDSEDLFTTSSSEDLSEEEEEEEKVVQKPEFNKFMVGAELSDSDDDVKRVVKSSKDKLKEEMEGLENSISDHIDEDDWDLALVEKFIKLVNKTNKESFKNPLIFIRTIIMIQKSIEDRDESAKLPTIQTKGLSSIKQKLRKLNQLYSSSIEKYKNIDTVDDGETEDAEETKERPQSDFTLVSKSGKVVDVTSENLNQKLEEIIKSRGKKTSDKVDNIQSLKRLLKIATGPRQKIKILFALFSTQLDQNISGTSFVSIESWRELFKDVSTLFDILESNKAITVSEEFEDYDLIDEEDKNKKSANINNVQGSIITFIERINDELYKSMHSSDVHSTDYLERLKQEILMISLLFRSAIYFEQKNQFQLLSRVLLKLLEHFYYKSDNIIQKTIPVSIKHLDRFDSKIIDISNAQKFIYSLANYLYNQEDSLIRIHSLLYHIYNISLSGNYTKARDILLMSHFQDNIHQADINLQILYNRALVQIGMTAFRNGLIKETMTILLEICSSGRIKELLCQGFTPQRGAASGEVERPDKQKQLPHHMHINLELIECIFLTSSMLIEIPLIADANINLDTKKRVVSKPFKRLMDFNERQVFCGPPETTREYIAAASKVLSLGDWKTCRDLILSIKLWNLLPDSDSIKKMLSRKIQEVGLKTYLLTFSIYYQSFGLQNLSDLFELPVDIIYSMISKMIFNEDLPASLDQINKMIIPHIVEPTKLQTLSLIFSEKVGGLIDTNEKYVESHFGNSQNNDPLNRQKLNSNSLSSTSKIAKTSTKA